MNWDDLTGDQLAELKRAIRKGRKMCQSHNGKLDVLGILGSMPVTQNDPFKSLVAEAWAQGYVWEMMGPNYTPRNIHPGDLSEKLWNLEKDFA
jgi:hypothetical protein